MTGRTNVGGAGGSAAVTVKGAPGSALAWTGPESGSGTLDLNGESELVLPQGNYTFTNTVTVDGTELTAFSGTVGVTRGAVIRLYPDGVIYWFGRTVTNIADGADYANPSGWETKTAMTAEDNCVKGTSSSELSESRGLIKWGSYAKISTVKPDNSGYEMLKARAVMSWASSGGSQYKHNYWKLMSAKDLNLGAAAEVSYADLLTATSDGEQPFQVMFLPDTPGEYYLGGYAGYGYKAANGITMKILAIWME